MVKKVVQLFSRDNCKVGEKMYIGAILKERMSSLNITATELASETLMDETQIIDILSDSVSVSEIDEMDLEFIGQMLYCCPDYFINKDVRNKDIINAAMNRGGKDAKSNKVKGQLQAFANDFLFVKNLL